ncbi:Uncharacterized conserved protein YfaP, DUF2135 family [Gracilibacillus ureilyticus]|uniref:Uncharacterized conserved protein YfaP, DUF2135 family n=1 Tax=Gracilibacillus ureilyticus TaxID=531814 RepID=A0A1H9UL55_9BACI|nr:carboxypeptidase regulatory-like domain-containing protein [Gracilibacillus ureilyticus]SES10270.1 Uncharacterized conserved protein YfaP, DUF2135 family [Gracilibacillus ureilyticus]
MRKYKKMIPLGAVAVIAAVTPAVVAEVPVEAAGIDQLEIELNGENQVISSLDLNLLRLGQEVADYDFNTFFNEGGSARFSVKNIISEGVKYDIVDLNLLKYQNPNLSLSELFELINPNDSIPSEINAPGEYGPASSVETINGDVTINSPGVTLSNVHITGNLVLAEGIGEGEVTLNNVTVDGETVVNGGGENSIYFNDTVLATVIVNKNTGAVRIVAQGNSQVYEVQLETPTIVEEEGLDNNANGFEDVVVSETMQSVGDTAQVRLVGQFETINSRASDIQIDLSEETDIESLILNAAAHVLGQGNIRFAQINSNGSTLSQRPQNVVLDIDTTSVNIGGEDVTDSYSDVDSIQLNSIDANASSINLNADSVITGVSIADFNVTATIEGESYELTNVRLNSNHNRITYDPIPLYGNIGKTVEITVSSNSPRVSGAVVSDSYQIGTGFSGRITDVQGNGISGITIKFREGNGVQEGVVAEEVTTDENGYYSVNLPAGMYTGELSGDGFVTSYMIGSAPSDVFLTNQNETAIRAAASTEVKIMLTWDQDPRDLDSHLLGPGIDGEPFHIAYYNKQEVENGITYADLDWDDTQSYGPETTTIRQLVDGEYRFYVHHFSGMSTLSLSGAEVSVFLGNESTPNHTFSIPRTDGEDEYWLVFDLNVSNNAETIEIIPINNLQDIEPTLR